MKRVIITFISFIVFILIGGLIFYFVNTGFNPYSIEGTLDAEEIAREAISKKDSSICEKITMPKISFMRTQDTDSLKTTCFTNTAKGLADASICEKSPNVDFCYHQYAVAFKDESLCKKDRNYSALCFKYISQLKNDINICNNILETDKKESCYIGFAEYSKNIEICDQNIKSIENKNSCYRVLASVKKDTSICQKITNQNLREECNKTISDYLKRIGQ